MSRAVIAASITVMDGSQLKTQISTVREQIEVRIMCGWVGLNHVSRLMLCDVMFCGPDRNSWFKHRALDMDSAAAAA